MEIIYFPIIFLLGVLLGLIVATIVWKGVEKHWIKMVEDLRNEDNFCDHEFNISTSNDQQISFHQENICKKCGRLPL